MTTIIFSVSSLLSHPVFFNCRCNRIVVWTNRSVRDLPDFSSSHLLDTVQFFTPQISETNFSAKFPPGVVLSMYVSCMYEPCSCFTVALVDHRDDLSPSSPSMTITFVKILSKPTCLELNPDRNFKWISAADHSSKFQTGRLPATVFKQEHIMPIQIGYRLCSWAFRLA